MGAEEEDAQFSEKAKQVARDDEGECALYDVMNFDWSGSEVTGPIT